MVIQKISMDLDEELYLTLKREALEGRTTMSDIVRNLIANKYEELNDEELTRGMNDEQSTTRGTKI